MKKTFLLLFLYLSLASFSLCQEDTVTVNDDTVSKFDSFNKKAEHLFKIIPVPLYSYSTEAGHIFGLAKYNLIDLYLKD